MSARTIVHAAAPSDDWPALIPLPDGLPAVPELDPLLLPDELRPWIEDIAERLQCPMCYPAIGAMVALAAVVGRQIGIRPREHDDWTVVPNVWGAIVGRPGVLKTPALQEPLRPLRRLEHRARDEYETARRQQEQAEVIRSAQRTEAKKLIRKAIRENEDPALVAALIENDDSTLTRRRYITQDPTVEKLGELMAANPRGILIFRDELTGWLRSLDRDGQECARAFYLEAWAGTGGYIYDRIGRGTIDIEAACVSVLGGIQPGPLSEYLRGALDGGAGDDGLLQRLQLLVWPDPPTTWRDVDRWPDSTARTTAWGVYDRLDSVVPDALGAHRDGERDTIPYLRLSHAAVEAFREWRDGLERRLRSGSEHPAMESHLSKYRSLIPSLALLLHLADSPEGGPVTETSMIAAIAWGGYLEAHARRLYAHALDHALMAARELERHLRRGEIVAPFAPRDIYRHHWRLLDRRGAEAALEYLEDMGYVRSERYHTGGRPRVLYHVHPALEGRP